MLLQKTMNMFMSVFKFSWSLKVLSVCYILWYLFQQWKVVYIEEEKIIKLIMKVKMYSWSFVKNTARHMIFFY